MATEERKSSTHLKTRLLERGSTFAFFQAVQLLHRLSPHAVPVGELGPASKEAIRFKCDPRLVFAASDITRVLDLEDGRTEVMTTFLGLTGTSSPLATAFSEELLQEDENEAERVHDFYDLFHHRLLSLLYRAWKKYRFSVGYRTGGSDQFTRRALAFVGADLWSSAPTRGLPPMIMLALSPVLAQRVRSSRMLEIVLERMFDDIPVRVEGFVERRVAIPGDQQIRLGQSQTTLHEDLTIGTHVIDRTGRFRVHVGPTDYDVCTALMPGGAHYGTLRDIVAQFTRGVLEAEVEVELLENASPSFQLSNPSSATLAVTTRLPTANRGEATRMRALLTDDAADSKMALVTGE